MRYNNMSSSIITSSLLRCTQSSTRALRKRRLISCIKRYTPTQYEYRCISHSYPLLQSTKANTTSNKSTSTTNNSIINSQPPLPIRIALVSSTTALATPSFPALGFLYLVLRVTIPDDNLRKVMEGRWGTVLSFTTWTLLPKLYHGGVTSIILPFAISNAIVAGSLYGMLDLATGGPNNNNNKILQTPWICGSGIGGGVGYIAPNYLYGPIMESMYGLDGLTQSMNTIMSYSMTTELSVVTGMVAGTLLHPMLYYPIHGIKGQKWQYFSGSALCITSAALAYVYYGRENVGLPIPDGSFIDSNKMALVDSVLRYNNTTNAVETYSLEKEKFIGSPTQCIEGQRIADTSRSYTANSNKVVFDDRVIAFVYAWWDAKAKDRYPEHIVNIKSQDELHQIQNSMTYTDVAVATILSADKESDNQANSKDVVMNIINNLNTQNEGRQGQLKSTSFKQLEDVTVAIELLMTMKIDQPSSTTTKTHDDDALRQTLEQFIKKRYPTLTLYTLEEQYKDESVESQLKNAKWIGSEYTDAVKRWTHVHEKETYRIWRNRSLIVVSGILLSIAGSLLQR